MSKDLQKGYSVPTRPVSKPSDISRSQNGVNIPRKKPEEHRDGTKPTKG